MKPDKKPKNFSEKPYTTYTLQDTATARMNPSGQIEARINPSGQNETIRPKPNRKACESARRAVCVTSPYALPWILGVLVVNKQFALKTPDISGERGVQLFCRMRKKSTTFLNFVEQWFQLFAFFNRLNSQKLYNFDPPVTSC